MLESIPRRLRGHLTRRAAALRSAWLPIAQMAVAAGLSWWVAHDVVGHTGTFFAPVAAAIVLRVAPGQRTRRALEMVAGIAVGIGVADVVVRQIGVGGWQIALIVTLAVSVAIMLGAGNLIASQAAATAVLVAAIPAPAAARDRFLDALIGGLIGLAVLIVVPRSPLGLIRRAVDPFLRATAAALAGSADALERRDADAAASALQRADDVGRLGQSYTRIAEQGRETALLSPIRWSELSTVDRYIQAAPHIDALARDTRVLCRAVRHAVEERLEPRAELAGAVRDLAGAVSELPELLAGRDDDGGLIGRVLGAAALAQASLDEDSGLAVSLVVGQVGSAAVDLLRVLGVERHEARAHVSAAGR